MTITTHETGKPLQSLTKSTTWTTLPSILNSASLSRVDSLADAQVIEIMISIPLPVDHFGRLGDESMSPSDLLKTEPEWVEEEFRHAYAAAAVEQGVAWQIRMNREHRGWTQTELARRINSKQSSVSRMEDPEYGLHSLDKLKVIAQAMDCALLVKFVPFSVLVRESHHLSPKDLVAKGYTEELQEALSHGQ